MKACLLSRTISQTCGFMYIIPLIFIPIAGKLRARTLIEVINLEIIFEGAASIIQDNNPMLVYEKLSSYIPTKRRRAMQQKMMKR